MTNPAAHALRAIEAAQWLRWLAQCELDAGRAWRSAVCESAATAVLAVVDAFAVEALNAPEEE